jgi:steroid delta-isomerase-like uncharacterized protein
MSIAENKALIRHYIEEVWNKGNVDAIDELAAENYARYPTGVGAPLNREGQKQRIRGFRQAFPDLRLTIEDMVAEDDKVVFRMSFRGTHQGTFMGIAPTGRQMTFSVIDIARIVDGKLVEHWGNRDDLSMLQQLGVLSLPG